VCGGRCNTPSIHPPNVTLGAVGVPVVVGHVVSRQPGQRHAKMSGFGHAMFVGLAPWLNTGWVCSPACGFSCLLLFGLGRHAACRLGRAMNRATLRQYKYEKKAAYRHAFTASMILAAMPTFCRHEVTISIPALPPPIPSAATRFYECRRRLRRRQAMTFANTCPPARYVMVALRSHLSQQAAPR